MWGYQIFENGDRRTYGSLLREVPRYYQTEVLTNKATQFIRRPRRAATRRSSSRWRTSRRTTSRAGPRSVTGKLVRPAPRDRGRYAHMPLPKPPSYNERHLGQAAVGRAQPRDQLAARGGDPHPDARALGIAPGGGPRSRGDHRNAPRHRGARQHVRDLHLRPRLHAGRAPDSAGEDGAVRPLDTGPAADPRAGDPARQVARRRSWATWTSPRRSWTRRLRDRRARWTVARSCRSRAT